MQYELDALKDMPLASQLAHFKNYLQYIFRSDAPEKYLESMFPETYQVYLLIQQYEQSPIEANATALQDYIIKNINHLAKELRSIRLEIIDWLDKK